jgi:nuclease S1
MNRSTLFISLILLLFGASARSACAFGVLGHQVIAAIAEDMLTPRAKAEVKTLLGASASSGGPATLAAISTWADEIRMLRPETRPWHYVTIQIGEAGYDSMRADSADLVKAIKRQLDVLANPKADRYAREEALKWVVHLVGDLHQPLHAGEDRDKGGNLAKVKVNRRTYNLHEAWDHVILERLHLPLDSLRPMLERRMAEDTGFAARYARGTVESWADDTHAKARACYLVNGRPMRKGIKAQLDRAYLDAAAMTLLDQMEKGAVRLAFVLNRALDPRGITRAPPVPAQRGARQRSVSHRDADSAAFFASADPVVDPVVDPAVSASGGSDTPGAYAWSVNSRVFHHSSCADVARILKQHLRYGNAPPPGKKLHKGCPVSPVRP